MRIEFFAGDITLCKAFCFTWIFSLKNKTKTSSFINFLTTTSYVPLPNYVEILYIIFR